MSEVTHGFSNLPHDLVMSSVVSSSRFAILSFLVGGNVFGRTFIRVMGIFYHRASVRDFVGHTCRE